MPRDLAVHMTQSWAWISVFSRPY